jgi:hypothetical protein
LVGVAGRPLGNKFRIAAALLEKIASVIPHRETNF